MPGGPCRIKCTGNIKAARGQIGRARSQLDILERLMFFQKLKQGTRKVRLDDDTEVECNICFGQKQIQIYSPPVGEELVERIHRWLIPRFFVRVNKGEGFEYYWVYFNKKTNYLDEFEQIAFARHIEVNEDSELFVWKVGGGDNEPLNRMNSIPGHSKTAFTKAFMLASDEGDKRYVAAGHLLTLEHEVVFDPMVSYPKPFYCMLGHCPPNRFYCNTSENMMVWYTAKSYNPEIAGQHFICGVVFNLGTGFSRQFTLYPGEANGYGFTPYWAVVKNNNEIPMSMMTEVKSLDVSRITVVLPWEGRPVEITAMLESWDITCAEVNDCDHRVWEGTGSGFGEVHYASLSQNFEGPRTSLSDSASSPPYNCSTHDGDLPACYGSHGHIVEWTGNKSFTVSVNDVRKHSVFTAVVFDRNFIATSDKQFTNEAEGINTHLQDCLYSATYDSCFQHDWAESYTRSVEADYQTKNVNSGYASWLNPNTSFMLRTRIREYIHGEAEFSGYRYGGPTWSDWQDQCPFSGNPSYQPISFRCFYFLAEMPLEIWDRMGNEQYDSLGLHVSLRRDVDEDDDNFQEVNEYTVDGKITLDSTIVEKTYYLDDRATEDNQGVIAAGKGPDFWDIKWKVSWDRSAIDDSVEYIDIKSKLLEVLGCNANELVDIGLI